MSCYCHCCKKNDAWRNMEYDMRLCQECRELLTIEKKAKVQKCSVCNVAVGEPHKKFCSAGNDIFGGI